MKRKLIIIAAVLLITAGALAITVFLKGSGRLNADPNAIVNAVYAGVEDSIKANWEGINTTIVDLQNSEQVEYNTGLKSIDKIESIHVSETLNDHYSYSFICIKLSKDANAEEIKNNVYANINMYKWKYVYAKKLAVVDISGYVFAIMGTSEEVDAVTDSLKLYAKASNAKIGTIIQKVEE